MIRRGLMDPRSTRRGLIIGGAALAAYAALPKAAQAGTDGLLLLGVGKPPAAAGGGGQTTIFDTAGGTPANVSYSLSNQAVENANGAVNPTRLGTSSLAGLEAYWEFEILVMAVRMHFGVAIAADETYLGNYGNTAMMDTNGAFSPTCTDSPPAMSAGSVIGVHYSSSLNRVWYDLNGSTFFGSSGTDTPSTGTGGQDVSGVATPRFPACSVVSLSDKCRLRCGTNIVRSPQSGFTVLP